MPDARPHDIAAVFGRAAATYDSVVPFFATFGRHLVDLARLRPGERVLDVACGRGASLLPAAEAVGPGGSAVGVDLAPEMVEALAADVAARGLDHVEVRAMDGQALELGDASFDAVLCGFSLWLFPDPARGAAEMRRVLRPGGRGVVSQPTGGGPEWEFFGPLVARFAPRMVGAPPPPRPDVDLAVVVREAGFTEVDVVERVEHFVFPDAAAWWRWVWSTGQRTPLEALPPDALDELKAEAFAHLGTMARPDGLHLDQRARFVVGRRPD